MSRVAFISGHRDIDEKEFAAYYREQLTMAESIGDRFVVGNAQGVDTLAVRYLLDELHVDPGRITIYIYGTYPLEFLSRGVNVHRGGYKSATTRDAAMTEVSQYDIAWERPEEACRVKYGDKYRKGRRTGTGNNIKRRATGK